MKKVLLIIVAIISISSCNNVNLSQDEAKTLIIQSLHLPFISRFDINKRASLNNDFALYGLYKAGLTTTGNYYPGQIINTQPTELGKSSYLGDNGNAYMFKTNDIVFVQITGISVNKDQQAATIRFTLKAVNVTLAGYILAKTLGNLNGDKCIVYSMIRPLNGELTYKKFDNGWQLATDENKSSLDLLNQILNISDNSNQKDDYTTSINNLITEFQAKQAKTNASDSIGPGGDTDSPTQFVPPANAQDSNYSGLHPQSSQRLLNSNDLNGLTKEQLKIMRNEIFARHGYIFKTMEIKSYFMGQAWYKPMYSNVDNQLSNIEKANVELIKSYEK